jgi:TonB family protein
LEEEFSLPQFTSAKNQELVMKVCTACSEQFESHFSFCPIDGSVLTKVESRASYEYHPTLISDDVLFSRLLIQIRFLAKGIQRMWPDFKAHPLAFAKIQFKQFKPQVGQLLARPYVLSGLATALAVVIVVVGGVLISERHKRPPQLIDDAGELVRTVTIDLNQSSQKDSKPGVGAGDKGRVGFDRGRSEGSRPVPARAQGGGSGGMNDPLPPSQGRPPIPSVIPAPIPTTYARLPQALPAAGIDIDPVLWKDLPFPNYGDPRSKSTTPSNGPGNGGGVGTNKGTGVGEGDGPGFGPGRNGNIGGGENTPGCCGEGGSRGNNPNGDLERIFRQSEVEVRARVLFKPEPQYTEEARRTQITGTVILSVVFSRTGQVTNIRAVQTLCCGLTEKAMAAARQIRFVPAVRNGQTVSTYMQLEYNFNLY